MIFIPHCTLCPRACGADRTRGRGLCGGGDTPRLARAALHHWEEPCISGERGSGTVFFSGCPLRCCFCQNGAISEGNFGADITTQRLADIFLQLQSQGAHNINLVTGTHYIPWIVEAVRLARPALTLPIVYNSGGYETVEALRLLAGTVDVYLPDLKYHSPALSARYSAAPDYFERASLAILEMYRQTGPAQLGPDGLLKKGLVVRHMVLPGQWRDSLAILDWLAANLPMEEVLMSLMCQYTPAHHWQDCPELGRRLSTYEYKKVTDHMLSLGILRGYEQERSSAKEEYTPPFALEGVLAAPGEEMKESAGVSLEL